MSQKQPKTPRFRSKLAVYRKKIDGFIRNNRDDACLLAGFLMVARGLWLVYHPAMWIVCGVCILWLGLPPRRRRRE